MKILYCHPLTDSKARDAIAFVDVELNEHVRLYALRLVRQPDGRHMLYSPQAGTRRTASRTPGSTRRWQAFVCFGICYRV